MCVSVFVCIYLIFLYHPPTGISGLSASVFTNQPVINRNNKPNDKAILSHGPSTFLLLHKENAFHAAASLMEAFMVQMSLQGVLAELAGLLYMTGFNVLLLLSFLHQCMLFVSADI